MANSIDLIVSKEAQAGLDALYKSLTKTHEEVVAISKLQLSFNGGQSPKSVSDLNDKIKENIRLTGELSAAERKLLTDTNKLETQKQKIIATQIKEIALRQKLTQETNKNEQALAREQAKLEASQSLYNKVQQKLNALNNEYKNLAIQKELTGKLTDSEAKRYEFLSGKITKYDQALKVVDGQMGKYQRNVGNYAGAFNPLSNSINQLSREMPAFANSVQTGFMAISNNLPIFFDAMGGIINQNKELQKQGLPTQSVLKQLAVSVFSLGTALSVGVTLLTLYGKEMVEWASSLFGASESLKALNESQKEFNQTRLTGQKDAQSDIIELKKYLAVVSDRKLSDEERNIALKKLKQEYPFYFKNLTDEQILLGQTKKAQDALNIALEKRKQVEKATEINVANKQRLIDLEKEVDLQETILKRAKMPKVNLTTGLKQTDPLEISIEQRKLNSLLETRKSYYNTIIKNDSLIIRLKKETIGLEYQDEKIKKEKNVKETKIKENKAKEDKKINQDTEDYFLAEISRLEKVRNATADTTAEYKSYNEQLEFLKYSLKFLRGELDFEGEGLKLDFEKMGLTAVGFDKFRKAGKEAKDETKKTIDEMSSYLKGFYDQFGSESGMPTLFKVLNKEIEGFGDNWKVTAVAMMEIGQELTNTLMKQSEARFNAEYARLEQQKNISIAFAGSSATAKAEIERQYEERRKSIQRRQAEAEKRQALFNIAVNTAQAIVATLGKTGFAGIPLSLIVGAIGAAQLAMVASQEIPAFAEGGVHEGGRMLINDAKGSKYQETVVTPDGKVRQFKGRNKVVDAPKGTQIFTPDQWSKQINNLLLKNNISPLQTNQTNGINKEDLESVFRKYSGSNEVAIDINENGFKKMISSNGRTREILNSRLTTKGRIV